MYIYIYIVILKLPAALSHECLSADKSHLPDVFIRDYVQVLHGE